MLEHVGEAWSPKDRTLTKMYAVVEKESNQDTADSASHSRQANQDGPPDIHNDQCDYSSEVESDFTSDDDDDLPPLISRGSGDSTSQDSSDDEMPPLVSRRGYVL